jgi:hypothetical protein
MRPELQGKPIQIARYIALTDVSFSGLSGGAVTVAIGRLKKKFNGSIPSPALLCTDLDRIGRITRTPEGESVCNACGRSYDFRVEDSSSTGNQRAFRNSLHAVYEPRGLFWKGRKEGMISQAATSIVTFGDGPTARLTRKALSNLADLCKDVDTKQLPQERTGELARLVKEECEKRGMYLTVASLEEAKDAVVSALVTMARQKDPARSSIYLDMVKAATVLFLDPTKSTKGGRTKHTLLEEEEITAKAMVSLESEDTSGTDSQLLETEAIK